MDDFLNKRVIGAKAPAIYMKSFIENNAEIKGTMESHLINIDTFGVLDNNYDLFFNSRVEAISKELQKRLIKQESDKYNQIEVLPEEILEEQE